MTLTPRLVIALFALAIGPPALRGEPEKALPTRLTATAARAWPCYGGPNHNGVIADAPAAPDGRGLAVLWKSPMLSPGHSGAAVVDGRVFIIDRRGNGDAGEDMLQVLDLETGKELWAFSHPAPGDCRPGSYGFMPWRAGPVSVPAVRGGRVFFAGPMARLYCVDHAARKLVWSRQLPAKVTHGAYSPSPLLVGDLVVVSYTGDGGDVLAAFSAADGQPRWEVKPTLQTPGRAISVVHTTPFAADIFGERQIVATHRLVTFGAEPKTGAVRWQYEGYRRGTIQAEVALSPEGYMFFTSGHDGASALVHMAKGEAGYHFRDIYNDGPRQRGKTRACSEWRPGHWWDGHLYHVSNHFAQHGLLCMDRQGKVRWRTREIRRGPRFGYSCLTIVNGVGLAMNGGTLHVIDLNPHGYKELGKIEVFTVDEIKPGPRPEGMNDRKWKALPRRLAHSTWAKHAYADGRFLTRNAQWLACVRVAGVAEEGQVGASTETR